MSISFDPEYTKETGLVCKSYFNYLTDKVYILTAEQKDSKLEDPKDIINDDTHSLIYALNQAGLQLPIIKHISLVLEEASNINKFIRKTAEYFNITILLKKYRFNKTTSRADSKVTIYGNKDSETIYKIGCVDDYYFAIVPTQITKAALKNPNLVTKHMRTDFMIKNNKVTFNNKQIKFLDSYAVVSFLFHNKENYLIPFTK